MALLNAAIQQSGYGTGERRGSGGAEFLPKRRYSGQHGDLTLAAAYGVGPVATILALGAVMKVLTLLMSIRLLKEPAL